MEAWEQKKAQHREAKRAQHAEMLQPMVWQLVTLAERSITYCQSLDATAVPKSTWKDWAQAFVQGCLDDEEAAATEAVADEASLTTQLISTPADKAAALVYNPASGRLPHLLLMLVHASILFLQADHHQEAHLHKAAWLHASSLHHSKVIQPSRVALV